MRTWKILTLCCLIASCFSMPAQAQGVKFDIPQPDGTTNFVTDLAGLLDQPTQAKINEQCAKLLQDTATPIIIVTIPSMAQVGGRGFNIETFARLLFDQWGIGHLKVSVKKLRYGNSQTVDHNRGILLVVSEGDRKARIELGAGWGREKDELCQTIMNTLIIPQFKKGDFGAGVAAGADALDKMARGETIPTPPRPAWHYFAVVGFFGLMIFTVVSLIRRGSSGWAWLFWGVIFAILGSILYHVLTSSARGGSGGGFSGGSFGGGFSGGGGASGSW